MMQNKPDGLQTPAIFYEVVSEGHEKTVSRFFALASPLESRDRALQYFLHKFFEIEQENTEILLSVYVRHHGGEQALLLTSQMFWQPGSYFQGLKRELHMYRQERIAVHFAFYDPLRPSWVKIFFPRSCEAVPQCAGAHFLLASQYWIFLRGRKMERHR